MRADLGGRGLGGLVAREIAMRRAVVDVISVVGGDNSAARAGNRIMGTQYHRQPLRCDAQLLNAPAVCDGSISQNVRHERAWNEGENSAVFGVAVAHGLAPAAAAASSDALRPKPLAASSGMASTCMLKCAMR